MGQIELFTPNGDTCRCFDKDIFSKCVAKQSGSEGELCDSGYCFDFDNEKLTTDSKKDFNVQGKARTVDDSDVKFGLYPLILYRTLRSFRPVANTASQLRLFSPKLSCCIREL